MLRRRQCQDPVSFLLPFYVNGSLEGDEARVVRDHIEGCPVCSRECDDLQSLARAIDQKCPEFDSVAQSGANFHRDARIRFWAAVLVTAVLGFLAAYRGVSGRWPFFRQESGSPAGPAQIAVLELGSGLTRDQVEPAVLELPPAAREVRLILFVPVRPGARYFVEIRDASGSILAPEREVDSPDPLGRILFSTPAEALRPSGGREVLVSRVRPDSPREQFRYPFTVRPGSSTSAE